MKSIGFLISNKEHEKRRAIELEDIDKVKNKDFLVFQSGYGVELGYTDEELMNKGCKVANREDVMKCDIICEPKIGDMEDLEKLRNKTIFGWIHATQNYDITQKCIDNKITAYAWEKMFEKERHTFSINNQIAGRAAILHAMTEVGKEFSGLNAAVLGRGNTAKGAIDILQKLGNKIDIYPRQKEKEFKERIQQYDIIVNCILWDITRKDHIIYKKDLAKLKKGAIIIDVSCDRNGGIETSVPTTIEKPTYTVDGIIHYVVDHTPTLLYKDATKSISNEVVKFLDDMIEEKYNPILEQALIIKEGRIIDPEINKFQNR